MERTVGNLKWRSLLSCAVTLPIVVRTIGAIQVDVEVSRVWSTPWRNFTEDLTACTSASFTTVCSIPLAVFVTSNTASTDKGIRPGRV